MEKKYLNEFVELFSDLPNALSIAAFELGYKELEYKKCQNGDKCVDYENSTERARDIEWKKVLEPHISEQTDKIERIFILQADKPESNLLFNLKNEIDSNLYSLSQDKILLYIKDIVRQFAGIAPFFDTSIKTNFEIGEHTFENTTKKYSKHLLEYFSSEFYKCGEKYENLSMSKKYFYNCTQLLDLFARELEKLCNTFDIDFAEVQRNLNIFLQWHSGGIVEMNETYSIPKSEEESSPETSSALIADGGNKTLVPSTLGGLTEEKTKELYELSLSALNACTIEEFIYYILYPTLGKLSSRHQGKTFILITALLKAKIINDPHQILLALEKDVNKYAKHPVGNANSKTGGAENLFAGKLEKLLNIGILDN